MNSPLNGHSDSYFNHPGAVLAKALTGWPWAALLIPLAACLLEARGAVKLWEHDDGSAGTGGPTIFDSSGGVIVLGSSGTNQFSARHAGADGGALWKSIDNRHVSGLGLDHRGDLVVTGSIEFQTNGTYVSEMFTAKRSATNGSILWESRLGDGTTGLAVAVDTNENVIAAGHLASIQVLLAKYRGADGQLAWQRRVATPNGGRAAAHWVAVDKEQNAIIGGSLDDNFFVGKYSGSDGAPLWEKQVPVNSRWYAPCVMGKVDSQGDVIATGGSFQEIYTAKFRGHDGSQVWERKLSVSQRDNASATLMEMDAHGNAVVTATYSDYLNGEIGTALVVKYGANNGVTIWERRIKKQLIRLLPVGLVVDTAQDVVLGTREQALGNAVAPSRSLLKLDGLDGTTLWEMPLGDFLPLGIAVGSDGRIAVTGQQTNAVTMLLQDEPRARLTVLSAKNGAFHLEWPESHRGLRLEVQDSSAGISSNGWTAVTSTSNNSVAVPLQAGSKAGFFRLVRP